MFSAAASIAIIQTLKTSMFNRSWSYPLLLVVFPLCYVLFAVWVNDKTMMKNEMFAGVIFFSIAILYVKYKKLWVERLLIGGFFLHAFYDISHDLFFINFGVPTGWAEFCGTVNLFIGCYLIFLLKQNKSPHNNTRP